VRSSRRPWWIAADFVLEAGARGGGWHPRRAVVRRRESTVV